MTELIRIAHVIGSTGLYGAERWILALAGSLDPRQADCTIVNLADAPGEPSAMVQAARARGLKAVDFLTGGRFNPFGPIRFSGWARRKGIGILHAHGFKSDVFSLFAARFAGIKVISTPHGWSKEEKDRKLKLYEFLDRRLLRCVDRVCPLSPDLWSDLAKCGVNGARNLYIANGVDLKEVDRVVTPRDKPAGATIIGYAGQLIERKNVPLLFRAFRSMKEKKGNLELWIVGDGPLRNALRRASEEMGIAGQVTFAGYREDALSLMKLFDVFVLPSNLEGIPRCVMEAMALEIPVVASDIPGNTELVEDRYTGLLFPPDDPARLAEAILHILDHPKDARDMSLRARARIEQRFSAARMAGDYLSLYRSLSASRDQGGPLRR